MNLTCHENTVYHDDPAERITGSDGKETAHNLFAIDIADWF
jgi:hypothetical protein